MGKDVSACTFLSLLLTCQARARPEGPECARGPNRPLPGERLLRFQSQAVPSAGEAREFRCHALLATQAMAVGVPAPYHQTLRWEVQGRRGPVLVQDI